MNIHEQLKYHKYMLDIKNFKIDKQVQSGGFGSVFTVQNLETNEILAAKVISMQKDESQYKRMFSREIGIMIRCQHPTIIRFYGYSLKDFNMQNNVTIFMEFAQKGSLSDFLDKIQKGLSDEVVDNTIRQIILVGIARGMMFLHQHKIIHRDLKPENILLDNLLHPHITDFGLSKFVDNYIQSQSQQCGTCKYMAPEVIEGTHYTGKVDVYSFGILMYQVVTDSDPYPLLTKNKLTPFKFNQKVVNENYRPTFSVPVKKSIQKLIEKCWSKNPAERPTFEEIFTKLAFGRDNSIEDIYDEQKEEEENDESNNYYLENVDVDEVVSYADEINDINADNQCSSVDLSKIKDLINSQIEPLRDENKQLKEKVRFLEQKISDIEKSSKEIIDKLIDEINNNKQNTQNQTQQNIQQQQQNTQQQQQNTQQQQQNTQQQQITQNQAQESVQQQQIAQNQAQESIQQQNTQIIYNRLLSFTKTDNNEFTGIINYFNLNGKNKMTVTASSFYDDGIPSNVTLHQSTDKVFVSNNQLNSWLCFDFMDNRIIPTSYTIRNGNWGPNNHYLKSWLIEVSEDNQHWQELARERDCSIMKGPNIVHTFKISREPRKPIRYFRIRLIGENWYKVLFQSHYHLAIESFEIYGKLILNYK